MILFNVTGKALNVNKIVHIHIIIPENGLANKIGSILGKYMDVNERSNVPDPGKRINKPICSNTANIEGALVV